MTTTPAIAVGQQYRGANDHILTVVRLDGDVRVICRNETDGYVGGMDAAEFAARIAAGTLVLLESTPAEKLAAAEIVRFTEARRAVTATNAVSNGRTPAYWAAVQQADIVREIAAAAVKATFRRISLARAREIVIYCADDPSATIASAAAALGYRNVMTGYVPATSPAVHAHTPHCAVPCKIEAAVAANDGLPLNVLPMDEGLAALAAITAAQCDGGSWCRCKGADGRPLNFNDALKPHARS